MNPRLMQMLTRRTRAFDDQPGAGGGGEPPTATEPPKTTTAEPPRSEPPKDGGEPPTATEPPKDGKEPPKDGSEPPETGAPSKPVNLMDEDDSPAGGEAPADDNPPTDEEVRAFKDAIKATKLGDGVTFDDAALDAMQPALMKLTGGDASKAEGLVKAYTDFRLAEAKAAQEQSDAFIAGLVQASRERFGDGLRETVRLAKAGGERIFGGELWDALRSVPQFANNPDIIERLAAFGKSTTDDPGAVRKERGPRTEKRDWRDSMYGPHK